MYVRSSRPDHMGVSLLMRGDLLVSQMAFETGGVSLLTQGNPGLRLLRKQHERRIPAYAGQPPIVGC